MTFWHACYQLLIGPLELLFEVIFSLAYRVLKSPGFTIVFLSLAVNFLVLPLYRRADALQAEQRDKTLAMKPWVDHIKRTFRGDERFMMLQTYYRQQGYRQTDVLKGSVSLLLEVPFFLAAYRFLSGLALLQGVSFGPIADLGAPDSLLVVKGVAIHVLPILMTLINFAAAAVYLRGFPLKSKLQMYGTALVFLVLLYRSPSGLVLYWTLNNLFSLCKNIFYRLRHPKRILHILLAAAGLFGAGFVLLRVRAGTAERAAVAAVSLPLTLPLLFDLLSPLVRRLREKRGGRAPAVPTKADARGFLYGCVFLALLTGLLIPSAVLYASPEEFITLQSYRSPLWYVLSALLTAVGAFVIWCGIFYRLASPKGKRILCDGVWILSVCGIVNYLFFGKDHGNLSEMLQYDMYAAPSFRTVALNLAVLLALAVLLLLIRRKKASVARLLTAAMCLALLGISARNLIGTGRTLSDARGRIAAEEDYPQLHFSKTGKNVIVLMLDRAVSAYLPYVVHEKPELKEKFDGFTFYSNTLSFGGATVTGGPPIFGGYEYRPIEINRRTDRTLVEKHNESLKVMPTVFYQNGFDVTVCDPSLAGYRWRSDLSIYDDNPEITAYNLTGNLTLDEFDSAEAVHAFRERNFFCYAFCRVMPVFLQPTLYNQGRYNAVDTPAKQREDIPSPQVRHGLSKAEGITDSFLQRYAVLKSLPHITVADSEDVNTFLLMCNDITHGGIMLEEPAYEPKAVVDNTAYDKAHPNRTADDGSAIVLDNENRLVHYHALTVAMLELGNWFDTLREQGVYDNTRIIIVSDHGQMTHSFLNALFGHDAYWMDVLRFSSLLLVKDFGATGFSTDPQFMTSADVPTLAFSGLIEHPVNPYTGQPITDAAKHDEAQYPLQTEIANFADIANETQLPGLWLRVGGRDIWDVRNWSVIGTLPDDAKGGQ